MNDDNIQPLNFVINKRIINPLEFNFNSIKDHYPDDDWQVLIMEGIKNYALYNGIKNKGTIWRRYAYSTNFGEYTSSFFIAAFGLPGLMKYLEKNLSPKVCRYMRYSDGTTVNYGNWNVLVHFEHDKQWLIDEGFGEKIEDDNKI